MMNRIFTSGLILTAAVRLASPGVAASPDELRKAYETFQFHTVIEQTRGATDPFAVALFGCACWNLANIEESFHLFAARAMSAYYLEYYLRNQTEIDRLTAAGPSDAIGPSSGLDDARDALLFAAFAFHERGDREEARKFATRYLNVLPGADPARGWTEAYFGAQPAASPMAAAPAPTERSDGWSDALAVIQPDALAALALPDVSSLPAGNPWREFFDIATARRGALTAANGVYPAEQIALLLRTRPSGTGLYRSLPMKYQALADVWLQLAIRAFEQYLAQPEQPLSKTWIASLAADACLRLDRWEQAAALISAHAADAKWEGVTLALSGQWAAITAAGKWPEQLAVPDNLREMQHLHGAKAAAAGYPRFAWRDLNETRLPLLEAELDRRLQPYSAQMQLRDNSREQILLGLQALEVSARDRSEIESLAIDLGILYARLNRTDDALETLTPLRRDTRINDPTSRHPLALSACAFAFFLKGNWQESNIIMLTLSDPFPEASDLHIVSQLWSLTRTK